LGTNIVLRLPHHPKGYGAIFFRLFNNALKNWQNNDAGAD
jgi:hypothetical protein